MRYATLVALLISGCFLPFGLPKGDIDCFYIDADGDGATDDSVCYNSETDCTALDLDSDGSIDNEDCEGPAPCCEIEKDGLCGPLELNVISIYEANSNHSGDTHPMGNAQVYVDRPGPQILVLSSYEPVTWDVTLFGSSVVQKIIALGYYRQVVNAPPGVSVESYSLEDNGIFFGCATDFPDVAPTDGCETTELLQEIEAITGTATTSFHGCYNGSFFVLNSDLGVIADCSPSGFEDPDCTGAVCVGIDDDQNGTVDREDCDLSAGQECIFMDLDGDGDSEVDYCGVICGCVSVDWDNDGLVDQQTVCNVNADQCAIPQGDFQCINSLDMNGDGTNDTFCDDIHSGCYYFDYSSNGLMDDNGCEQPDNPECPGIDENQDGVVDRYDCNINASGECLLGDKNDDGVIDSIYCGAICGCVFLDVDGDGQVDGGALCNTDSSFCPPTGEECSPADLDLDGISESYYCDSGCYLSDLDQSGTLDDYCQGTDGCYTIDLDRDGVIEDQGCQPISQCSLVDADGDGFLDDTYCEDTASGCFLLDLESDGLTDDENCAANGQCVGIDSSGDGVVDVFDCTGNGGCIGVDFDGDGIVDQVVCPP